MQLAQCSVGLHLGDDAVDEGEKIVLTLAHQHTDFAVGEGAVEQRGGQARVVLHVPRGLGDFRYHHVGLALGHLRGDFLVLLVDDNLRVGQVRQGKLLVQTAGFTIARTSGRSMSASDW